MCDITCETAVPVPACAVRTRHRRAHVPAVSANGATHRGQREDHLLHISTLIIADRLSFFEILAGSEAANAVTSMIFWLRIPAVASPKT